MKLTVGIPTYNEEDSIVDCIKSCFNQTYPPDEIIVVASGCTDKTVPNIEELMKEEERIKLVVEKERNGKISAINLILSKSKGEIVVHTDGDVLLSNDSLEKLVYYFDNYPFVSSVSGTCQIVENKSRIFYEWSKKTVNILNRNKAKLFKEGNFFHLCGYIFAHRKGAITNVPQVKGATDATMGSLLKSKGEIIFDPSIIAYVKHTNNVRDFIRQKARIRYGFLCLNQSHDSNRTASSELVFIRTLFTNNALKVNIGFLFIGLLYLASWLKAYYWFNREVTLNEVWKPVISTK